MERPRHHYVHGTDPREQHRLSRLNTLLNDASLREMRIAGGERVLDVGSGLGQLTRLIARKAGPNGRVIGVERDADQIAEARKQAREDGEEHLLELRQGDATDLPLERDEWGTFDFVHARFVLEHVTDPEAVVRAMVRAARPGGRIILEDDDHEVLRLWPEPPGVLAIWQAYYLTYELRGKDPFVGRHLVAMLHDAGAVPRANRCLFFGSCAGSPNFEAMSENFIEIISGAKDEIATLGLADELAVERAIDAMREWQDRPDAALWYSTYWAEATRPEA